MNADEYVCVPDPDRDEPAPDDELDADELQAWVRDEDRPVPGWVRW